MGAHTPEVGAKSFLRQCNTMRNSWRDHVDPAVDTSSRWHSTHVGLLRSKDRIGDSLVATLRDAARRSEGHTATRIAFCGRGLLDQLAQYEQEPRLLIKLADTGRVVTALVQGLRTAIEVVGGTKLAEWREELARERDARVSVYAELLDGDGAMILAESYCERQQLEILTRMKHDFEIYGGALTPREEDVIVAVYERIAWQSGLVVAQIPSWFATTATVWPDAEVTSLEDDGEEKCLRLLSLWSRLHHPNVQTLYGACHVGIPFTIQQGCELASNVKLSWKLLLGYALGLNYLHTQGVMVERMVSGTLLQVRSELKGVISGASLSAEDDCGRQALDVMELGYALFGLFDRVRGNARHSSVPHQLPEARPEYLRSDEWRLLCSMCSSPSNGHTLENTINTMGELGDAEYETAFVPFIAQPELKRVSDVTSYIFQPSGQTMQQMLDNLSNLAMVRPGLPASVLTDSQRHDLRRILGQVTADMTLPESLVIAICALVWDTVLLVDTLVHNPYSTSGSVAVRDSHNAGFTRKLTELVDRVTRISHTETTPILLPRQRQIQEEGDLRLEFMQNQHNGFNKGHAKRPVSYPQGDDRYLREKGLRGDSCVGNRKATPSFERVRKKPRRLKLPSISYLLGDDSYERGSTFEEDDLLKENPSELTGGEVFTSNYSVADGCFGQESSSEEDDLMEEYELEHTGGAVFTRRCSQGDGSHERELAFEEDGLLEEKAPILEHTGGVSKILGKSFLLRLRNCEQSSSSIVAVNFLRRDIESKITDYYSEPRALCRWANTGCIVQYLVRAMESALDILNLKDSRLSWDYGLIQERHAHLATVEQLLEGRNALEIAMGDHQCKIQVQTLLRYALDNYWDVLNPYELDMTSDIFDVIVRDTSEVIVSLPSWFADSDHMWSFAQKSEVADDEESFLRQVGLWAKLNHPNIRKFYGACWVGDAPHIIHDKSQLLFTVQRPEDTAFWSLVLDYARGLQYLHSRGLAHLSFSLNALLVTWEGQYVLSGMGLTRLPCSSVSDSECLPVSADVLQFGITIFEIMMLLRLKKEAAWLAQHDCSVRRTCLEILQTSAWNPMIGLNIIDSDIKLDVVAAFRKLSSAEWIFFTDICAAQSRPRSAMSGVIRDIAYLAKIETTTEPVLLQNVRYLSRDELPRYKYPSSHQLLKDILDEVNDLCDDITIFSHDNRPVVERLLDIYKQMKAAQYLQYSLVEDFAELVQRFFYQLSNRLDQCNFGESVAMSTSVALTVADRNYSLHHQLDELMWSSYQLNSDSKIHQWRPTEQKYVSEESGDLSSACTAACDGQLYSRKGHRWILPPDEVQICKRIASGSFGAAYWGKWLGSDVVVKKVLTNQLESRNRKQFEKEAGLWFSLNHAHLIKLYGACLVQDKQPVFVCEQAVHGTLSSFLNGKNREEVWGALYGASQGLRHLHERGIVHGDLKGNNVLVCGNNLIKLADFGLSVSVKKTEATPALQTIGAIRWKAPECLQGDGPTFASDIYSFGMCIIEMVTNKFPWGHLPDPAVEFNVVKQKLLPSRGSAFNDNEWNLVKRMCHHNPDRRIGIGAVVCHLYELYSGPKSVAVLLEPRLEYERASAIASLRFNALRKRTHGAAKLNGLPMRTIPQIQLKTNNLDERPGLFRRSGWLGAEATLLRKSFASKMEFVEECNLWFPLDHPNVVKLYGACLQKDQQRPCLVSEWTSETLVRFLDGKGVNAVWRCLNEAALGLRYLHDRGIIHGNLTGQSIVVCNEVTKLVGGGSGHVDDDRSKTQRWTAPEILEGGKPTFAADIFSFGMCIIEAITGEIPWGNRIPSTAVEYFIKHEKRIPERPAVFNDQAWELVRCMCRYNPESRSTITTVVSWIEAIRYAYVH